MLAEFAEGVGHQIVGEAETADGALEEYKKLSPDLVFLDLSLMDGDGLTTLRNIRETDPDAKVMVISGNAQRKVREQVMAAGAIAYISKPVDMKDFQEELGRVVI